MHYKAPDNSIHYIERAFEYLLPPGCVPISDEEAEALRQTQILSKAQERKTPVTVVTMRQARLALLNVGLLGMVNDAIAAMQGAEGDAARIEWEFSSTVDRGKTFVQSISSALGLSESQLDELFELANTL